MTQILSARPAIDTLSSRSRSTATRNAQAALVVNPSKFGAAALERFHAEVDRAFVAEGWLPPLWLPTTAQTRGVDEARLAKGAHVDVILVAGGDGTIRTVAQELAGSGVAMALLPMGTGNLFARNLGIPLGEIAAAVHIACTGEEQSVDVGWLQRDDDERVAFLVMAGAGFDAAMMDGAGEALKARIGPAAYVLSGIRAIRKRMSRIAVTVDGRARSARPSRGVVVGNCGTLTMGLNLMPEAAVADGLLDGVELLPRSVPDWLGAAWSIITGGQNDFLPRFRGEIIEIRSETPLPVEVDGDVVGEGRYLRIQVEAGALRVRCPGA